MDGRITAAASDEARWRALVEKALGGAALETLISRTHDHIPIEPLYAPAAEPQVRPLPRRRGAWRVCARIDHAARATALEQARRDLAEGADGLNLVFAGAPCAYGLGLRESGAACARAFLGELAPPAGGQLQLDCPALSLEETRRLLEDWAGAAEGSPWSALRFAIDPALVDPAPLARAADGFGGRVVGLFCADGRRVHGAGGTQAQELAFALSAGLRVLRGFEATGSSLEQARARLAFRLAADTDFLVTVVKFRAIRLLWARVEEACGLTPRPIELCAETAWRMMTKRDPWSNALRAGVAAAGAALGGADALVVLPHTQALGLPDPHARRLARATQLILLHEAHLAKVLDPAGGAGAFEVLTQELCAKAWSLFQEIEASGGLAAALGEGHVQHAIGAARAERLRAARTRREPIIGASLHPALDLGESAPPAAASTAAEPYAGLPLVRFAEDWEDLQQRVDQRRLELGERPKIVLLAAGEPWSAQASVAQARELFETAGFAAPSADAGSCVEGFAASGARLVCLCLGSDASLEIACACASSLAAAKARRIYACGAAGTFEAALRACGVRAFLRSDCDAVALLEDALAGEAD